MVYKFLNELRNKYKDCQPNSAHKAIAELEMDYDVTVITQNIDDLHEKAGSTHVIHLHGGKVRAVNNTDLLFDYPEGGIIPGDTIDGHRVRWCYLEKMFRIIGELFHSSSKLTSV